MFTLSDILELSSHSSEWLHRYYINTRIPDVPTSWIHPAQNITTPTTPYPPSPFLPSMYPVYSSSYVAWDQPMTSQPNHTLVSEPMLDWNGDRGGTQFGACSDLAPDPYSSPMSEGNGNAQMQLPIPDPYVGHTSKIWQGSTGKLCTQHSSQTPDALWYGLLVTNQNRSVVNRSIQPKASLLTSQSRNTSLYPEWGPVTKPDGLGEFESDWISGDESRHDPTRQRRFHVNNQ